MAARMVFTWLWRHMKMLYCQSNGCKAAPLLLFIHEVRCKTGIITIRLITFVGRCVNVASHTTKPCWVQWNIHSATPSGRQEVVELQVVLPKATCMYTYSCNHELRSDSTPLIELLPLHIYIPVGVYPVQVQNIPPGNITLVPGLDGRMYFAVVPVSQVMFWSS